MSKVTDLNEYRERKDNEEQMRFMLWAFTPYSLGGPWYDGKAMNRNWLLGSTPKAQSLGKQKESERFSRVSRRQRMESKRLIKLNLAEKLKKKAYRSAFFRARAQDEIAASIKTLREKRGLSQVELAKVSGMKQSAVSRIEQAEYSSWTYRTLQRIAEALEAQMYIVFVPAEDVIARYEDTENFRICLRWRGR